MHENNVISYETKALRAQMRSYARRTKAVRYSKLECEIVRSTLLFLSIKMKSYIIKVGM